jgi:tRNA(fMet)-specific endonuclease VapC
VPLYLADTNIVIAYARGGDQSRRIESKYNLMLPSPSPLVSIVTVAEARAFAEYRNWGEGQKQALAEILRGFVTVPISRDELVDAYVEIDTFSRRLGRDMGKDDLWIATTASVSGAILLTTDADYDHLHGIYLLRERINPEGGMSSL